MPLWIMERKKEKRNVCFVMIKKSPFCDKFMKTSFYWGLKKGPFGFEYKTYLWVRKSDEGKVRFEQSFV